MPSEAYDSSGFVGLRFKTAPSILLLVMNYSEGIGFLSVTDRSPHPCWTRGSKGCKYQGNVNAPINKHDRERG